MKINKILIKKICSLYCDKQYSMAMIAEKSKISIHKVRYWLEKNNIPRRNRSDAGYLTHIHRFNKRPCRIKAKFTPEEEKLLIAGIMLYIAEGSKKDRRSVALANSDPKLIQLFLRFLRETCGVHEERLRIIPHFYTDQDEKKLRKWWSQITGIPLTQFCKSYIHKAKKGTYKKKSEYGTISLRYNDKKLLNQILQWIKEYFDKFLNKPT